MERLKRGGAGERRVEEEEEERGIRRKLKFEVRAECFSPKKDFITQQFCWWTETHVSLMIV